MRVLVMGAGAVGGYYGGLLAHHGHDVTFVARGVHLAAMRERGLEIRGGGQSIVLRPVTVVESPAEASSEFDLIFFTVKGYDTEPAADALKSTVGAHTAVLTLQNGVDSVDQLSATLGGEHVLAGAAVIESTIAAPGVIDQPSPFRKIVLGELSGEITPRLEAIAAALRQAGVDVVVSTDARLVVWEKFVVLAPNAILTTACQAPMGPIRETPEGAALYRALIEEAVAVGRAEGVALPANAADTAMATIMSVPPTMKTSLQRDYERQNRVELEQLAGAVVRRGQSAGVPTPAFATLYAILKVRAQEFGGLA